MMYLVMYVAITTSLLALLFSLAGITSSDRLGFVGVGLLFSVTMFLLYLVCAGTIHLREARDACELNLPRTEKCVMIYVPESTQPKETQ